MPMENNNKKNKWNKLTIKEKKRGFVKSNQIKY